MAEYHKLCDPQKGIIQDSNMNLVSLVLLFEMCIKIPKKKKCSCHLSITCNNPPYIPSPIPIPAAIICILIPTGITECAPSISPTLAKLTGHRVGICEHPNNGLGVVMETSMHHVCALFCTSEMFTLGRGGWAGAGTDCLHLFPLGFPDAQMGHLCPRYPQP